MSGAIRRDLLPFEADYTQVPNDWARDARLSFKARGVLVLLLSHRPGYPVRLKDLAVGKDGLAAVRAGVGELEALGYLERVPLRERGVFRGHDWLLKDPRAIITPGR